MSGSSRVPMGGDGLLSAAAMKSARAPRGARSAGAALLMLAAATGMSGCSTINSWFGPSEQVLEGERVALRAAARSEASAGGVASFAPARSVREWPQAGGASNRSLGHADGSVSLQRVWSASVGAGSDSESRITASPVASAGRIYTLDAAATVTAVSEKDGDEIWSAELAPESEDPRDGFGGGLAAAGAVLVAATGFGEAIGLNAATGEELWRAALGAPVRAAPTVSKGVAVILARDGTLTALSVKTGEQIWS
ncbi:MAG: PQQ-binding-like beta-propeller repeat protein, partial [Pseudomonadota bacterium]